MWEDYAASVKDAVASMREVHVQMMSGSVPATLPERITLHDGLMTGRLEAMKSTNAATLSLYNALDDAQKKKDDELIHGHGHDVAEGACLNSLSLHGFRPGCAALPPRC